MDSDNDTIVADFQDTLGDCYITIPSVQTLQAMCIQNAEAINSLMQKMKCMLHELEQLKRASSQSSSQSSIPFGSSLDKKPIIEYVSSSDYTPRYIMPKMVKKVFDDVYETNKYPTPSQKRYLEELSGLSSKSVNCWFTNRRKRQKKRLSGEC